VDYRNKAGYGITHLYCSLMDRAVATGSYVSLATGVPLTGHVGLHESGGLFEEDEKTGELRGLPGRTREEFQRDYPNLRLPEDMNDQGWWSRPAEPQEDRPERARRIVDWLRDSHGGTEDRVAIVSHGGFFNWFLKTLLGIGDMKKSWIHMNNTAITRVDFLEGMDVIQYVNRTDHLSAELVT
jgi:2,3-bisphosphoglycerate-dependent phosphoglycerate mutase